MVKLFEAYQLYASQYTNLMMTDRSTWQILCKLHSTLNERSEYQCILVWVVDLEPTPTDMLATYALDWPILLRLPLILSKSSSKYNNWVTFFSTLNLHLFIFLSSSLFNPKIYTHFPNSLDLIKTYGSNCSVTKVCCNRAKKNQSQAAETLL